MASSERWSARGRKQWSGAGRGLTMVYRTRTTRRIAEAAPASIRAK